MESTQDALALKAYLSMIYRRKLTVLAVFGITSAAVVFGAFLFPQYTAQTTLIVRLGREFVYRPEPGDPGNAPSYKLTEMVNSVVEVLNSRELSRLVVEELGVDKVYPMIAEEESNPVRAVAKAANAFQSQISVRAVLESSIIKVSFEHENAEVAAKALNLLVDKFQKKHQQIFSDQKIDLLQGQLADQEDQLVKAEKALADFRMEQGLHLPAEQKRMILTERFRLETELRGTDLRIAELRAGLANLKSENTPREIMPAVVLADQRAAIAARRRELYAVRSNYDLKIAEQESKLSLLNLRMKDSRAIPQVPTGADGTHWRFLDDGLVRLLDLRMKEQNLLKNYREPHREVIAVRNERKQLESFLKDRGEDLWKLAEAGIREELVPLKAGRAAVEKDLESLDQKEFALNQQAVMSELIPLGAKRDAIVGEIERLKNESVKLEANEKSIRPIERKVAVLEKSAQLFGEECSKARIAEELEKRKLVNVKAIEPAEVPILTTGISKKMKIALGMFAGLLAGATSAFLLELLKR